MVPDWSRIWCDCRYLFPRIQSRQGVKDNETRSAVNQNNTQYWSVSAWTIIPLNCLWSDLKFYKQDKSKNQDTSVLNSHHCHYPRLWNNVHQISYHSSVNVGGHVVPKKALKIPPITNPTSLSSPQCLCLSHSLSLSHKPPSSYAPPSPPVFSLSTSPFLCLSVAPFFPHMPVLSVLWHSQSRGHRGMGIRVETSLFVDLERDSWALSSPVSESGKKSAEKRARWFTAVHICVYQ